jgi:hypothetical protein
MKVKRTKQKKQKKKKKKKIGDKARRVTGMQARNSAN